MKRAGLFLLLFLCGCAAQTAQPISPTLTREITPVSLLLTPVMTPVPLPALPPLVDSTSSKPLALSGDRLITVNPDSNSLTLVDSQNVEIALGGSPRTVALQGREAFVTLWDANALALVDIDQHTTRQIESFCHMPYGVVADQRRAYVSCFADDQIAVFDPQTETILYRVTVPDAPYGLALSGNWLLVTHLYSGQITVLNVERTPFVMGTVNVDTDGELARTIVIAPDGKRAYIPQTRTGLALISLQYMQDWFPVVSVFDIDTMRGDRDARLTLSTFDSSANLPSDAALSPDGSKLYVALQGSDALMVIDTVTNQLLARIPVGVSPVGVWVEGAQVFVLNVLDGTVSVIDAATHSVTEVIRVTDIPLDSELLRGKILFHRAPEMSDGAVSCATCHFEGGADGRTWINFRSGARNTPALGGIVRSAPYHWSGDMGSLQASIDDQIRHVMLGDSPDDLNALATYVASLETWESPYRLPDGGLSEPARRGMALFMSGTIGCGCHAPPLYTDLKSHNLAGGVYSMESANGFDTPTLRGLWATAPYLHDGVAQSLQELFTRTDPVHSIAGQLSEQQLNDLIAFLLSL